MSTSIAAITRAIILEVRNAMDGLRADLDEPPDEIVVVSSSATSMTNLLTGEVIVFSQD